MYLVSSQDLEGVHDLVSSVLVNCLTSHEGNKVIKGDVASLIGVYILPQLVKGGVISLRWKRRRILEPRNVSTLVLCTQSVPTNIMLFTPTSSESSDKGHSERGQTSQQRTNCNAVVVGPAM